MLDAITAYLRKLKLMISVLAKRELKNGQSRNMLNHLLTGQKCLWTQKFL
nr:MAG TPA: hypothetical protein [Bacteriophage sp.]